MTCLQEILSLSQWHLRALNFVVRYHIRPGRRKGAGFLVRGSLFSMEWLFVCWSAVQVGKHSLTWGEVTIIIQVNPISIIHSVLQACKGLRISLPYTEGRIFYLVGFSVSQLSICSNRNTTSMLPRLRHEISILTIFVFCTTYTIR
jgi:hypothetical protein